MQLIKSEKPQCVLAAFAMVTDTLEETLIEEIGHDGMEVILPELDPPFCYRSFHPEEFTLPLQFWGYSMTMVSTKRRMVHGNNTFDHTKLEEVDIFTECLRLGDGVIFGVLKNGTGHAVAWNFREETVYDPRGYKYKFTGDEDFSPLHFVLIQRIE